MRNRMAFITDYMNDTITSSRDESGKQIYQLPGYLDKEGNSKQAIEESRRLAEERKRLQE